MRYFYPNTEIRLGGMANGMLIEKVGIVKWIFETGSETLVLTTYFYYIPSTKDCSTVQKVLKESLFTGKIMPYWRLKVYFSLKLNMILEAIFL